MEVLAATPTKSRSDGAQLIKTCDWSSLEIKAPVTPYIARIRYIQNIGDYLTKRHYPLPTDVDNNDSRPQL